MADTGWVTVGTGAEDSSYGTLAWGADASNVTADDSTYASSVVGSGDTYYLKGTNLGLALPAGSIIDGIEVRVEAGELGGQCTLERVRIVKADASIGTTDRGTSEALTGAEVLYTYGGAADLWGETWGASDVNDVDFGFVVSFNQNALGQTGVDYMQVKVYYNDTVTLGIASETDTALDIVGKVARPDHFELAHATVLELDLDLCANVYGVSPCTAALAAGSECYNTWPTCQDKANYVKTTKTWKFCSAGADVPPGEQIRPYIEPKGIATAATEISLEKGLAPRAKVTVKLADDPSSDAEADPYYATRATAAQGSFFARLMARNRNYAGRFARLKTGYFGAGWNADELVTELYIIEKIDGPDSKAQMIVTLKDPIKLTDRAAVPAASAGLLLSDITDVSTTLPLRELDGAGYDATGHVRIGDEIIKYTTNTGDVLGGLTRAQFGTTAATADAGDGVQLCKVYEGLQPWQVLEDLLLSSGLPAANIDSAEFQSEDEAWLGTGWEITTCLSEPEDASKHLEELVVQVGGFMWFDPATQKARFLVLAPLNPEETVDATLTDTAALIEGSVKITVLEDLRRTQQQIWYDRASATGDDDASNFRRVRYHVDADAESANDYGDVRPEVVYSRWFTAANDAAVGTVASRRIGYYRDAPKNIEHSVDAKDADIREGDIVDIETAGLTDVTGAPELSRCIVLKRKDEGGRVKLLLRVLNFGARYAFIAPDGTGDYPTDPQWVHIAPDTEVFDDGTPAYQAF